MNSIDLAKVQFKGFDERIRWDKVFCRSFIESECSMLDSKTTKKDLRSLFFHTKLEFKYEELKGSQILCFQSYIDRKSSVNQFDSFCKLVNGSVLRETCPRCKSFTIPVHLLSWFRVLKSLDISIFLLVNILKRLDVLYSFQRYLNNYDFSNIKLLVTFYDSMILDAFIEEFFRIKGVKTATLQHGQFTAWRENSLINSGVELRSIHSDYFFAWNEMTIEEAKKQGLNVDGYRMVGILGNIGQKRIYWQNPNNNVFGVVLDHPYFEKNNNALLAAANKLASDTNKSFVIKPHPLLKEDDYLPIVNTQYYRGSINGGKIIDYANKVEFSLVGSSSVFVELTYVSHPTIRYSDKSIGDKFKDVPYGKTFDAPEQITESFNKEGSGNLEQLFNYLCGKDDVDLAYKTAIKEFLIK